MSLRTFLEDFRDLRLSVRELMADQTEAEEAASNTIVTCASRFSRRSKRVVDDKLSFSATLMRAGEVDAANRLLNEVEREVRAEEAALIETVNEVKVAQTARRERITRLRLACTLAAATLGAGVLTVSAAGMAVAGFLQDRAEATRAAPSARALETYEVASAPSTTDSPKPKMRVKRVHIGGVKLVLTAKEFRQLEAVTQGGDVDEGNLESLFSLLPRTLAQKVQYAIAAASGTVQETVGKVETVEETVLAQATGRKARRAARSTNETTAAKKDQPKEPAPEPSESPDSGSSKDGGGDGGPQNESESDGLPLPEGDI
jgi:hypothetical protein